MDETMKSLLLDYYDSIMGKGPKIPVTYFHSGSPRQDEGLAAEMFKHVLKKIFRWNFDDAMRYLTPKTIAAMYMQTAYGKLIFPPEIEKKRDAFYVASYVWPRNGMFTQPGLVILLYRHILSTTNGKFPKSYFISSDRESRSWLCLSYAINKTLGFESVFDIYSFFANEQASTRWLRRMRIECIKTGFYKNSLEMIHALLPEKTKNEEYYQLFCTIGPVYSLVTMQVNKDKFARFYTEEKTRYCPGSAIQNYKKFNEAVGAKVDAAAVKTLGHRKGRVACNA